MCARRYVYVCMRACGYVNVFMCMCVCVMCACRYVYVRMCAVCLWVCVRDNVYVLCAYMCTMCQTCKILRKGSSIPTR